VPGWNLKYNYIIKTIQFMYKPYMHKVSVGYSLGNMPVLGSKTPTCSQCNSEKAMMGLKGKSCDGAN